MILWLDLYIMEKNPNYISAENFEGIDKDLLKMLDKHLLTIIKEYDKVDTLELEASELREKVLTKELKVRAYSRAISPTFFEERKLYLLHKYKRKVDLH